MRTLRNMKVCIQMIKNADMVYSLGKMVIFTRGVTLTIADMDMDRCIGRIHAITRVNGKMVSKNNKVKMG